MNEAVIIDKIKFNGVIYDSLELVNMVFDEQFTKHHFDMIYTLLSLYNDNNKSLAYKIKVKDLLKIYDHKNPWRKGLCEATITVAKSLMRSLFIVHDKKSGTNTIYHWVDRVTYPDNISEDDYVEIVLHSDIDQFFSQMKTQNLILPLKKIMELSTLTEKKIYRWAYAKKGFKNDVPISIDDAKLLFCGRTDIRTADFIRYSLAQSVKAINKKTDLYIEFEAVRADATYKQKITSIKFKIRNKNEKQRTEAQIKYDKERNKKMWQIVKDQEEIISEQEATIAHQKDTISKISNDNYLVEKNSQLEQENMKLKLERSFPIKNRA